MTTQDVDPTPQPNKSYSTTASKDKLGLGNTPGQRGAEILAGLRAEIQPTAEAKALSRLSGRIVARLMMRMVRDLRPLNFTLSRALVIDGLVKKALPAETETPVIVEIASGLAPRGLLLAREFPNATVIEIDQPGVVEEKQKRLQKRKIDIPPNLKWLSADLVITPLPQVLDTQKAHVICAEGLLPYLKHDQIETLGQWVSTCLHPGGAFIADVPLREGVYEIQELASFFARQAGNWYGTLPNTEFGKNLLQNAGFSEVHAHVASHFIQEFNLPHPLIDISCFLEAKTAAVVQ